MEKGREIGRFVLIDREKRLHAGVVWKHHDDDWLRRNRLRAGQGRVGFAKLFETSADTRHLLRGRATKDGEMGRAGFEPGPLYQGAGLRLRVADGK
jgi:hypothetical protein